MTPEMKEADRRPSTPETLPGNVSSCSLEEIAASLAHHHPNANESHEDEDDIAPAITASSSSPSADAPSSVCQQRKLSAAIVTSVDASSHDFVAGRPTVTVEDLAASGHHHKSSYHGDDSIKSFETPPPKPPRYQRGVSTCDSSTSIGHKSLTRQSSAPSYTYNTYLDLINDPHALRVDAWAEAPATSYSVRGASYLDDRKKTPSEEALFTLLTVDVVQTPDGKPILKGLCNHPNERIQRALRREKETGVKQLPDFIWAVNLAIPGPPLYHIVMYFGCDDIEELKDTTTPLGRLTKPFFFGDDDNFRDNTFKLIPRIVDGNFVVKKAVGTKPAIIGRKLKQHYIRDPRFMELIVDISSDSIAKSVVGLSMGYAKQIVPEMVFVLEGDTADTLPERILAGARLKNLDFKKRDGHRVCKNYY